MKNKLTKLQNFSSSSVRWLCAALLLAVACGIETHAAVLLQPTGISATASPGSILVKWTDNSTGESNYAVERKVGTGGFSPYATLGANSTSYTDTSVTPGTLYTYRVYAYVGTSASVYSPEASATPPPVVNLQQPTGISATASPGSILVKWTDNSTGESNYAVERKVGTGGFSPYATLGANSTSYTDTSVTPGTLYTYRVYAYVGTSASVYSPEAPATAVGSDQGVSVTPLSLTFSFSSRSVVDLLVFFTPAAAAEAGGAAQLRDEIAAAVKESNQAYLNSGVNHRLRLLSTELIDYVEAAYIAGDPTTGIGTDIVRLTATSDGYLDSVHTRRDQVGADVVALIVASNPTEPKGGISKLMHTLSPSFESDAFCVVMRSVMKNRFALPHEIGHIMGCGHDHAEAVIDGASGVGVYPYSYGYIFQVGGTIYGDIMTYTANLLPYFSNPDILYNGVPMGVPGNDPSQSANCALSMNNTAATVAAFRNSVLGGNGFTIANSGPSRISVTSISPETPAPWLSVSPQGPFSVEPNTTYPVTVQVNYALAPNGYSNVRLVIATDNANANPISGGVAVVVDDNQTPQNVTITWPTPADITYGTPLSSVQLSAAATFGGTSIPGNFAYSPTLGTVLGAGNAQTLSVTFSPADTTQYLPATATVNINVMPAPLTVTANDASRTYGSGNPAFVTTITGFVNGDTMAVVSGAASVNTTATASSPVGSYSITPAVGTLSAVNYTFANFVSGTLTVTAPQPVMLAPRLTGQVFSVMVPTAVGVNYSLEYKDSVAEQFWRVAKTLPGTGENVSLTDDMATSSTRFYHIHVQ
jgi:hypothetical protein